MASGTLSIIPIDEGAEPALFERLSRFERGFTYPLGNRRFRIEHGTHYGRFWRAMGPSLTLLAVWDGEVVGAVSAAERELRDPRGHGIRALYVGDLKLAPRARSGWALRALLSELMAWAHPRCDAAFSVIMDGTAPAPDRYTGRAGIPAFEPVGSVGIVKLEATTRAGASNNWMRPPLAVRALHERLTRGRYAVGMGHAPSLRSAAVPLGLVHPRETACGLLEDTVLAKRLLWEDRGEIRAAHLSCFAFSDARDARELLDAALRETVRRGFDSLFVAVADSDLGPLSGALSGLRFTTAGATIYGCGLQAGAAWNINTSEV